LTPFERLLRCEKHGVWLHLDGAWGASMVLSPEKKHLFEGADLADSNSWDAHKMMGIPLTSSVLLTKEQDVLTKHLSENADYLFQQDTDWLNPGTRSIQCGRRNDFLKVWTGWQVHGDAGYAERIRRCLELVQYAVDVIRDDPRLELALEPESLNVCFTVKGACSKEICASLYEEARVMVGFGQVAGQTVVRVIFLNPVLTTSDLDYFFRNVLEVATESVFSDIKT
jgi:glutamate/tyrosine decarboxylase-like PLP-dependent enzyme